MRLSNAELCSEKFSTSKFKKKIIICLWDLSCFSLPCYCCYLKCFCFVVPLCCLIKPQFYVFVDIKVVVPTLFFPLDDKNCLLLSLLLPIIFILCLIYRAGIRQRICRVVIYSWLRKYFVSEIEN